MLWKQSTNIKWYVVRPFISSNCDDLGCMSRSFIDCILFFLSDKRVSQCSAIAELLVHNIRSLRTSGRRDRMSVVCVCVCLYRQVLDVKPAAATVSHVTSCHVTVSHVTVNHRHHESRWRWRHWHSSNCSLAISTAHIIIPHTSSVAT